VLRYAVMHHLADVVSVSRSGRPSQIMAGIGCGLSWTSNVKWIAGEGGREVGE